MSDYKANFNKFQQFSKDWNNSKSDYKKGDYDKKN